METYQHPITYVTGSASAEDVIKNHHLAISETMRHEPTGIIGMRQMLNQIESRILFARRDMVIVEKHQGGTMKTKQCVDCGADLVAAIGIVAAENNTRCEDCQIEADGPNALGEYRDDIDPGGA